jgi:predicted deacetylase
MIYCKNFGFTPTIKTIEGASDDVKPALYENVQVAFIQVEKEDEVRENDVEKKLVKNLKWVSGKNNSGTIILHSFAHLSDSKASPEFTKLLFDNAEERLAVAGYKVHQTPFGYFLDLKVDAPGFSLARVFKNI